MRKDFPSLRQAIPYIKIFSQKIFVLKLGGEVCDSATGVRALADQLSVLHAVGMKCVVVHGGGTQATELSQKLGIESEFIKGRRVTSPEMLQVMKMAIKGVVNTDMVSALNSFGISAVGLSGVDAALIESEKRPPKDIEGKMIDFGSVGDIKKVNPKIITALLDAGFIPVIACLSGGADGEVFNINGDTVATQIAIALKAEKLIFLTDVDGVMRNLKDSSTLISHLSFEEAKKCIKDGVIAGGMIPKIENCLQAISHGVPSTHIINGINPDSLILEVFTNEGCGTMATEKTDY